MEAYHLKGIRQVSVAAFAGRDELLRIYYDIAARAPGDGPVTRDEFRRMLQTLLADRFRLTLHRETKEMPAYALVVGRNGFRLKENPAEGECSVQVGVVAGGQSYSFAKCPIGKLVEVLDGLVDRPVVDQTRLSGKYDFRLVTLPGFMNANQSDTPEAGPFTAVQELGLKLEPRTSAIEVVAVDRFEKPGEN